MKKKLEAELISIAHRILKLKNKEDVRELHHETQKLYEKLSVLLFVEENFDGVKPTIGIREIEEKLERAFDFDEKIVVAELKEDDTVEIKEEVKEEKTSANSEPITQETEERSPVFTETPTEEIKEDLPETESEPIIEEIQEESIEEEVIIVEEPEITTEEEPVLEKSIENESPKEEKHKFLFEDILSNLQPEPVFERVDNNKTPKEISKIIEEKVAETKKVETQKEDTKKEEPKKEEIDIFAGIGEPVFEKAEKKPAANLNDKLNKGINITLNDRIAFEKNLFDGSTVDLNRVISQISTFDNFEDAKNFIDEMVRPDYNDWKGKDEFVERFMEFVESKFA
ncbi:hypothetical protein NAT51_12735 [Flavobacterium amniphilum]|uniref:hypothetical protein n=1 Tax=Flavobacterium amniphilum TaxID=1834035 RepID=UPI002029D4A0|nr:hypothetical protein [Flavobacterium amniphilum]MCL9805808.1 hypothetical protein [Flavobacterium amniphilum]MCL9806395.1 hypothetical protein [Flavobacterium amniphilum]